MGLEDVGGGGMGETDGESGEDGYSEEGGARKSENDGPALRASLNFVGRLAVVDCVGGGESDVVAKRRAARFWGGVTAGASLKQRILVALAAIVSRIPLECKEHWVRI